MDSLSSSERESSIVYIEQRVIPAGEVVPWAGITRSFDEPVIVAFIDLEPALNWSHQARYLILKAGGGIKLEINVDQPPFLKGVSPHLRLIHVGEDAPDWTVVAAPMKM